MRALYDLIDTWAAFATTPAGRAVNASTPPPRPARDARFRGFCEDSRAVQPGDAFVARRRRRPDGSLYSDGHPFIAGAVAAGAVLVITEDPPPDATGDVVYWQVPDSAVALAWLAAAWYGFPGTALMTVGVTGTDGKTSVAAMLYEILVADGRPSGMLSTIAAVMGADAEATGLHVTTPQAPEVQAYLRRMVDAGLTHCVLEATSMGLAEHRVDTAFIDVAAVTNITHEHLDYHGDWNGYLAAKARLFTLAQRGAVLNRDDAAYDPLLPYVHTPALTYGLDASDADVTARDIVHTPAGTSFTLVLGPNATPGGRAAERQVETPLLGRFNVYNMLAAAAAAATLGVGPDAIARGLRQVDVISGRMEAIDRGQPFLVVVDFAHTPNALDRAIAAARALTDGRIITVFGSAGRRDVAKRRLMAEISAAAADISILTAEDPRGEALADILSMMADGARARGGVEGETFERVPDRGRAIYRALEIAAPGDLVLICGKGHEQSMNFDGVEYPWDDRDAARVALDAFLAGRPMPDLGLPTFTAGA